MRRTAASRTAVSLSAVSLALVAGCAKGPTAPPAAATSPEALTAEVVALPSPEDPWDDLGDDNAGEASEVGVPWDKIDQLWEEEMAAIYRARPLMERLWRAEHPRGPLPQIALRFVRALQRHDDYAAGLELSTVVRNSPNIPEEHFHRVMADVRRTAGLEQAAPCTSARMVATNSAVVSCGPLRVVVHVRTRWNTGVTLVPAYAHRDVYRGPHRHAFLPEGACRSNFWEAFTCSPVAR